MSGKRAPRPMPYWHAGIVYRRVGRARWERDVPIPFYCDWDTVRMISVRHKVSRSSANVRRYGQGHPYARSVLALRPRSYIIRRHTMGGWR